MMTTLMRIGYCKNGTVYLETRFHDGSFPEVYTLGGDALEDYELADTFQPTGGPIVVERQEEIGHNPSWDAAVQALLASIDEEENNALACTIPSDLRPRHTRDGDCTLDADDTCTTCGVYHGDACDRCGGRGFHAEDCPEIYDHDSAEYREASARFVALRGLFLREIVLSGIAEDTRTILRDLATTADNNG
jgi:hypothetical protein